MSKKTKRLLGILLLLVCVVLVYVAVTKLVKEEEPDNSNEPEAVSQVGIEAVQGMVYASEETSQEAVSLIRKSNIWYYEEDEEFPIDQEYVTSMVKTAAEVTANRTVDNPSEDLSEYGLDNPLTTVTLKLGSGKQEVFYIGSYNQAVEGYYLKLEGSDKIYVVSGQMKFAYDMTLYDIAKKEEYPLVESTSFTHIKIENGETVTEIKGVIEEGADEYISSNQYVEKVTTWKISENGAVYKTGDQTKLQSLITSLSGMDYTHMQEFRSDETKKAKYGLDESAIKVTVDYEVLDETTARQVTNKDGISEIVCDTLEKQYVLYIGKKIVGSGYYEEYCVQIEGSKGIYTIESELLDAIVEMSAKDYY